jgi:hypothetical protein
LILFSVTLFYPCSSLSSRPPPNLAHLALLALSMSSPLHPCVWEPSVFKPTLRSHPFIDPPPHLSIPCWCSVSLHHRDQWNPSPCGRFLSFVYNWYGPLCGIMQNKMSSNLNAFLTLVVFQILRVVLN